MTEHINKSIAKFVSAGLSSRQATDKALALEGLPRLGVAKLAPTARSVTADRRSNPPTSLTRAQVRTQDRAAAASRRTSSGSVGSIKKVSKPVVAPKRNLPSASSSSMRSASQSNTRHR